MQIRHMLIRHKQGSKTYKYPCISSFCLSAFLEVEPTTSPETLILMKVTCTETSSYFLTMPPPKPMDVKHRHQHTKGKSMVQHRLSSSADINTIVSNVGVGVEQEVSVLRHGRLPVGSTHQSTLLGGASEVGPTGCRLEVREESACGVALPDSEAGLSRCGLESDRNHSTSMGTTNKTPQTTPIPLMSLKFPRPTGKTPKNIKRHKSDIDHQNNNYSSSRLRTQSNKTLYEHANFQGRFKQVTVSRCQNVLDFNDQASSLRTSGCVMLYADGCCQGASLTVTGDLSAVPWSFNDILTSLSPCGEYRTPFPDVIQEKWLGHSQIMRKKVEDGDIAIYYNDHVAGTALANHKEYLKRVWQYVKQTYGYFGPEGGRVAAFMHANVQGIPGYGFNSLQNYFDISSDCRNLVDLVQSGRDGWSRNLTGYELDVFTHEISHIVEGSSKRLHFSPSYQLWGDSKWAEIFIYDVYNALGLTAERDRFFQQMQTSRDNFPRENTYWFKNWFYPIYSRHGGARLLNAFFDLLAAYFPKNPNGWQYDGRSITLGEFVHFFSGAARTDLKSQAMIAFKWDNAAEMELQQAKRDFPNIRY